MNEKTFHSTSTYIDIETGEIIPKNKVYLYQKIKTNKNVRHYTEFTVTEWTIECKRKAKQLTIDFP